MDRRDLSSLTPTQQRVRERLLDPGGPRPAFEAGLAEELRSALETGIAPFVSSLPPATRLSLNKHDLARVHSCEGSWIAERDTPFAWSIPTVRGVVAHKAVELSISLHDQPPPATLVDLAIERLIEERSDWGPSDWLLDSPATHVAEVRQAATDWMIKFADTFPPLRRAWRPRVESPWRLELAGGVVTLRGKVDLALGQAQGSQARVLIVDFKTGRPQRVHVDDLRLYALLETLRVGVPPFRLATFSLDSGTWQAEDVTVEHLAVTVQRVLAGVAKIAKLLGDPPEPLLTPGPACRWCGAVSDCPAAAAAKPDTEEDGEEDRAPEHAWS